MKDMNNNYFLSSVYLFVVKAGFSLVIFICSSYMKEIVNHLIYEERKFGKDESKEMENTVINKDINNNSSSNVLKEKEKNKEINTNNKEFLQNFFHTQIFLVFLPLTLSFCLQIISLYIYTFVKSTSEIMKRNPYLIFILVQTISFISSLLPVLF